MKKLYLGSSVIKNCVFLFATGRRKELDIMFRVTNHEIVLAHTADTIKVELYIIALLLQGIS